jgi:hypothetical protein
MKARALLASGVGMLLGLAAAVSGCAFWQGPRTPNLVETASEPTVEPPPAIDVIFSSDAYPYQFTASLYNTARTSPIMRAASFGQTTGPVHYLLFLDGTADKSAISWVAVDAMLFLWPIPARTTEDVAVTGFLYEAATGKELGAYEAKGARKTLAWLPLFPATPFTLAFGPSRDELYDATFQDIFIQVAQELHGRALPPAVDPSRLEIKRTPSHMPREIRVP